jgi:hypothetical protein
MKNGQAADAGVKDAYFQFLLLSFQSLLQAQNRSAVWNMTDSRQLYAGRKEKWRLSAPDGGTRNQYYKRSRSVKQGRLFFPV